MVTLGIKIGGSLLGSKTKTYRGQSYFVGVYDDETPSRWPMYPTVIWGE